MSPIVAASIWALAGVVVSLALRPAVVRSWIEASPSTAPPTLGVLEGLTAALFAVFAYRVGVQFSLLVVSEIGRAHV